MSNKKTHNRWISCRANVCILKLEVRVVPTLVFCCEEVSPVDMCANAEQLTIHFTQTKPTLAVTVYIPRLK